ncbi:P-loop containing nucleoside triphosphate hydrolases superfamily protein [Actinidia rufa]|uniref:ATP-dependent RNA helicase n=1 Tax=Actinidia rufa TaxID=165716 RepID=A0A7J0FHP6_9ERIC|nr:P-loop containing nucleoside triphosphate hydrolases superfamily protein [Actinidia rufa]
MPVKLLSQLCLLNLVTRFAAMKADPRMKNSSRVVPILSRIFPHRLRYHSLSTKLGFPNLPTRQFSTRSGLRSEDGALKSLIDDETEISDWVSGLKSDSFQTCLYSSDDDKAGSENWDGDRHRGKDERGGQGRVSPGKRWRESDSDDYSSMRGGGGGRDDRLMKSFRDLISEEYSEEEDEYDDGGGGGDVLKNASGLFPAKREASPLVVPGSLGRSDSYLSETRFDQCSVSSSSLKGIKDAGYEHMTVVQEATLPVILKGKDVLAKAKTGTGKTVAFLLPSIEVVLKSPPIDRDQKRSPIFVLIICPTRELASQATAEANTLLKYHPSIGVQVVIGGRDFLWSRNGCQQILARLKDHIENTAGFATRVMGVKVLVLDEADHLLDMGFRRDIEHIIAAVRQICHIALKRDHEFIDTIGQGTEETLTGRVLVFCTTAMVTRLVADLLGELNLNVRDIHSRKPQSYRTRISDEFRKSKGLILVTSDVSAHGVDYPEVTLVIQVSC